MRQHPDHMSPGNRSNSDSGFTLPELLIAMMISGILIVSISMAFTTVLRTQSQATNRLAESKDITFVQTWMPVDLSSALETFNTPSDATLLTELAALNPPMSISALQTAGAGLPGTNVITVVRPDLEVGPGVYYIVSYRYHQVGGEWQISRYEIRNPGLASEVIKVVGVAHEIPAPPPGWTEKVDSPIHAVEVTARNQVILRPIGENVTFNFESGNKFISGGAGLSAENALPADGSGGLTNPSAPPSRCGGRMALIIDTSGSVPHNTGTGVDNGGRATEIAASSFLQSFSGTPYSVSLNGFDIEAYGMTTTGTRVTNGARAPFVSLLNGGAPVQQMVDRVQSLDDIGPTWPGAPTSRFDPNSDGVMWNQIGPGTNWEDGLYMLFNQSDGTPYGVDQPDLVVFITDGEPNRIRTAAGGHSGNRSATEGATAAAAIANSARRAGAETIGVMVGNAGNSSAAMQRLLDVAGGVGSRNLWNGSVSPTGVVNVGNAATADVFKGSFSQLGGILKSIMIAECGGTLTLQKRVQTAPGVVDAPATGKFTFVTSLGDRVLDRDVTSSVTFDYPFAPGVATKTVEVRETTPGYRFLRAECTAEGVPVPTGPLPDGTAGAAISVSVDKAVSCLMISEPSS